MKVIVLGNGGHSKVIQEMISSLRNHEIIAILDDRYEEQKEKNAIVYAPLSSLNALIDKDVKVVIAIGSNIVRKRLAETLKLRTDQYLSVIHPTAVISSTAIIGNGTVVMPNAVINADAEIGEHCIINTGAIVEHDNRIANYAHISPNATLTGNVSVGEGVHIGASATIIPGMKIGQWSVIGAGSTVIQHISSHCKAVGCPTRIIHKN
ncbi:acetyltransferase [Priestia aryabhattai]|uniref:acetyltransferase n=1 Tax=Priestia megaterium TaxID=1404 RepID=UPI0039B8DAC6